MKNSQQEVEGYGKPDRVQQSKAFTSLHLSPTCTKGDAERKVTTMMKQREAYVERLKSRTEMLGFQSGGKMGAGHWKDYDPG